MVSEYFHFLLAVSFAYAFYLTSFHLKKNVIFNRIAIWLMDVAPQLNRRGRRITEEHRARRIERCVESMWKLTYFIIMEICFLVITYNELKLSMVIYYMSRCGFYVYSIVSSIFWETRRGFLGHYESSHLGPYPPRVFLYYRVLLKLNLFCFKPRQLQKKQKEEDRLLAGSSLKTRVSWA